MSYTYDCGWYTQVIDDPELAAAMEEYDRGERLEVRWTTVEDRWEDDLTRRVILKARLA